MISLADVSDELIQFHQHKNYLDLLQSLLPNAAHDRPGKQDGGTSLFRVNPKNLPFKPLKTSVQWLPLHQQDYNTISLSEEIEKFYSFVSVRHQDNILLKHFFYVESIHCLGIFVFYSWMLVKRTFEMEC